MSNSLLFSVTKQYILQTYPTCVIYRLLHSQYYFICIVSSIPLLLYFFLITFYFYITLNLQKSCKSIDGNSVYFLTWFFTIYIFPYLLYYLSICKVQFCYITQYMLQSNTKGYLPIFLLCIFVICFCSSEKHSPLSVYLLICLVLEFCESSFKNC